MATLEKEFNYFRKNQQALYAQYPDKILVIQNECVVGAYDTDKEALYEAFTKGLKLGTFTIQRCGKDSRCYTQFIPFMRIVDKCTTSPRGDK